MHRVTTITLAIASTVLSGALLSGRSMAAEPVARTTPLVEKRETFTATGYAVVSVQGHRNPAQQRLLAIRAAKLDAYRSLTEQVYGLNLDATTTVADMMVQNDSFRTRVEGVIYGAKLVSITPTGDDTYETTLSLDKAVVQDLRMLYLGQVAGREEAVAYTQTAPVAAAKKASGRSLWGDAVAWLDKVSTPAEPATIARRDAGGSQ